MVYAEKLCHQYAFINQQTAAGLYYLKRTATTLKQLSVYNGVDVSSTINAHVSKSAKYGNDNSIDHQAAYQVASSTIVSAFGQVIDSAFKGLLSKMHNEIAAPLYNFYHMSEKMRVKLTDEAHKFTMELATAKSALGKEREACMSAYAATVAKKKLIENLSGEKQAKEQKKYPAMQQKLAENFAAYEARVKAVNELQTLYFTKRLPAIVNELEALERSRLAKISDVFEAFSSAVASHIEQLKTIHTNVSFIPPTLDQDASINNHAEILLAKHGRATPVASLSYDLPVGAEEVRAGQLTKPGLVAPMRKVPIIAVDSSTLKAELSAKYTRGFSKTGTLRLRRKEILDVRAKAVDTELPSPTATRQATAEEDHLHDLKTEILVPPVSPRANVPETPRTVHHHKEIMGTAIAQSVCEGNVVVALHDYTAVDPDDLSFKKDEKLTIILGEGRWWTAKNTQEEEGLIPSNFFSLETEGKSEGMCCVALHDYTPDPGPDQMDYLPLTKGDVLIAQPRDDDWWYGTYKERSGFFPMTFVQVTDGTDT